MNVSERNQCDGCRRGLPLKDGVHRGEGYDAIGCTAHLYANQQTARVGDRVQIVGNHPWSGFAGRVVSVDALTGHSDNGITVSLDCGLRATVSDPRYWRLMATRSTAAEQ